MHANEVAYKLLRDGDIGQCIRAHYTQLRTWHDPLLYLRDHEYYKRIEPGVEQSASVEKRLPPIAGPSRRLPCISYSAGSSDTSTSSSDSKSCCAVTGDAASVKYLLRPTARDALKRPLAWPKYDSPDSEPEPVHRQSASERSPIASSVLNVVIDDWDMSFSSNEGPVNPSVVIGDLPALNQLIISNVAETVFDAADHMIRHMSMFVNECCSVVSGSFSGFEVELQQKVAVFATLLIAKLDMLRAVLRDEIDILPNKENDTENNVLTRSGSLPNLTNKKQTYSYHTRPRGPVKDLPNVQSTLLECKKND